MRLLALCLSLALALSAEEDPRLVLKKISRSVAEVISRSDNYICEQDLSRFYYVTPKIDLACQQPPRVPAMPPSVRDRLKLDVAVSQGAEIYSWHGEHKFSAASVSQLVREGPISSGSFNGYLRNIFGEPGVNFIYRGLADVSGVDVYQFDYDVPLASSHYQLQAGKGLALTPFHGSFSGRADTFELYSLTVTATGEQIPQKSDICSAETRLTYQLVKISSHESLVPASYDLLMGSRKGIFTDSQGKYSGCREYTGESTVHFDSEDTAQQASTPTELESEPVKAGILLPVALRGQLDEDTAYAGLQVEALLTHDTKLKKGSVLSRGATLHGTVTRFEVFNAPAHSVVMDIEFSSITDGNKLYLCRAIYDAQTSLLPSYGGMRSRGMAVRREAIGQPANGSMTFNTPHLHLDKNFTGLFITVAQAEGESQ